MKILITGANGFIGQHLCNKMLSKGYDIRCAIRNIRSKDNLPVLAEVCVTGNIDGQTDWTEALKDIDVVIHLASVTHQKAADSTNNSFLSTNVAGTEQLLHHSIKAQVKRFIYMSSTKVYGEEMPNVIDTVTPQYIKEDSPTGLFCDFYGSSKLQTENSIQTLCLKNQLPFVIIRPPLVYGPGVGANFKTLMRLVNNQFPLPFLSFNLKRSLIAVDNLSDFTICCVNHPQAVNQIFLISDHQDISLSQLIQLIRKKMGLKKRLFNFPPNLLALLAKVAGKSNQFKKIHNAIQLDISKSKLLLNWKPTISVENAIQGTVKDYLTSTQDKLGRSIP